MNTNWKSTWLALCVALAACGGGGGDSPSAPPPAGPPASGVGSGGGGGGTPGADTTAPTVAITSPANFADNLSGSVTLQANATDNVGVAGVEFQLDGVAVGSEDTAAPYQATIDTTTLTAGQHVLRARARDAANNRSAWVASTVRVGGTRQVPQGFTKTDSLVGNLLLATAFAQAPDGRFFVAEQNGTLRVVKNGVLLGTPFLTLAPDSNGERGLIGVALDPAFATNQFVYVYYTSIDGGAHNRISRFKASSATSDTVSLNSESVLLELPTLSSFTNHNGGALHFGNDGKLYIGVGDNANSAQAPDLNSMFGKMLRINADGSIPTDNPFFGSRTGNNRAIWAYGLRNPFTFAVHPSNGRIHINDVGQSDWEEINVGAAGANYGWPNTEGPTTTAGVTAPLFAYNHAAAAPAGSGPGGFFTGFVIAGGAFYPSTGGSFPASYRGSYFFADFASQYVGRLDPDNSGTAYAFATLAGNPVDMTVGIDGSLYVLQRDRITRISAP
jgi:glucose/arabinose dehydrogenase